MCRYYTAEGVRIYSQETWNTVTDGKGKQLVEQHIDAVVHTSVSCSYSHVLLYCTGTLYVSSDMKNVPVYFC